MMNLQRFAVPAQGKVVKSLNAFSLPESNLVAMTSEGIEFDVSGYNTDRLLFVARNDNASTAVTALKVKAGDGYAAGDDVVCDSLAAGKLAVISVETARFGSKGKVKFTGTTDVKMVAVYLG